MGETRLEVIRKERLGKLKNLIKNGFDPYPSVSARTHLVEEAQRVIGESVTVAGRITGWRAHGGATFADLIDSSGKIQLFFRQDSLGEQSYKSLGFLDVGDFLEVTGEVVKTKAGEISVQASSWKILGKSLRPIPSEWYGLKDVEERYRKRYLDLMLNPEVKNRFVARSKLVSALREYLNGLGYMEVETPTLQPLYGGANAKPFKTHANALDANVYLRIADELYLKRLIVGGYEKIYEICKDFRNEGFDLTHQPEFTMVEYYEAYADYHRVMDVTEGLFRHLAKRVYGHTKMKVGEKEIEIGGKWPRIEMSAIIKEKLGLDVEKESTAGLSRFCHGNKVEMVGGETKGQLIYTIFEHKVTDLLDGPVWIIDYPQDVSPLSKAHRGKQGWVERFEGYIGGKEICDGWSELTNPLEQRERFMSDIKAARKDREEAQQVDEDFLEAMEYGMPPIGGIGIGIDRLTMFFTNTWSIKEVMLYPLMRPARLSVVATESMGVTSVPGSQEKGEKYHMQVTREQAWDLLTKKMQSQNLRRHCLSVEAVMRALARHFNSDQEKWGIVGLLHDGDYEVTKEDFNNHAVLMAQWVSDLGETDEELLEAIRSHGNSHRGIEPQGDFQWSLFCCDELTGLIVAVALVQPSKKLADVTVEAVMKKFKVSAFAAGAKREDIQKCEEKLGIPLKEFIGVALKAMQGIALELGL